MLLGRQKLLLSLLKVFGELSKTELMKYLFLFIQENQEYKKYYSFVPYKYGCYSFMCCQDENYLIKNNYLIGDDGFKLNISNFAFDNVMLEKLDNFKNKYGNLKGKDLIKYTYLKYPFYALNSEIKNKF
ncbi:MAG: hypothetical protein LBC92_05510 [Rickettsiales bacterium]|jgi:hypothetical protein|nr:hypothetical protein [Rickettsiales bacterium]